MSYLKGRLADNGGKWLGFKTGKDDAVVVRIRRSAKKYFYLVVDEYDSEDRVRVSDRRRGEHGVAVRFDNDSFVLESIYSAASCTDSFELT
jgi:hypothetical protein